MVYLWTYGDTMDLRDPNVMNMVNMGIFMWIYTNDNHELNRNFHLNSEVSNNQIATHFETKWFPDPAPALIVDTLTERDEPWINCWRTSQLHPQYGDIPWYVEDGYPQSSSIFVGVSMK